MEAGRGLEREGEKDEEEEEGAPKSFLSRETTHSLCPFHPLYRLT
jgi:hypothetical protein